MFCIRGASSVPLHYPDTPFTRMARHLGKTHYFKTSRISVPFLFCFCFLSLWHYTFNLNGNVHTLTPSSLTDEKRTYTDWLLCALLYHCYSCQGKCTETTYLIITYASVDVHGYCHNNTVYLSQQQHKNPLTRTLSQSFILSLTHTHSICLLLRLSFCLSLCLSLRQCETTVLGPDDQKSLYQLTPKWQEKQEHEYNKIIEPWFKGAVIDSER